MILNSCLSIIILHINGLNAPVKRNRVSKWIKKKKRMDKKQDPSKISKIFTAIS